MKETSIWYTLAGNYPSSFTNVRFWTKIEFPNVVKCRWVLEVLYASQRAHWRNPGGGSGGKAPEKYLAFLDLDDK